jgi:tetratricopeptide (TPR) repeat protein
MIAFILFMLICGDAAWGNGAIQNYARGVELAEAKKWKEAKEKFALALGQNPASASAAIEWARAAVMLGKRREALERLSLSAGLVKGEEDRNRLERERDSLSEVFYTNSTFQRYQNGLNFIRLARTGEAFDAFQAALLGEPDNVAILFSFAQALFQEDRGKEALAHLERAHSLHEGNEGVRLLLAEISLPQNPERTLQLLRPLAGDGVRKESVVVLQAQGLVALQKEKEALVLLRTAVDKQQDWWRASFLLGKLFASEASEGWNARKYLMTFLRRTELLVPKEGEEVGPEQRRLLAMRAEGEAILQRVNKSLE